MLTDDVRRRVGAYVAGMDRDLPGVLTGLYLVGSVALGDYHPRRSNIDVVALGDTEWGSGQLATATRLHEGLGHGRDEARVAYVTAAQLPRNPATARIPSFRGRQPEDQAEFATPMTWHLLAADAMAIRGPEWFECWHDDAALRAWALERLQGRWRAWWTSARRRPGSLWTRLPVTEGLLEVARLYTAATTGQVLSKMGAGDAALADVPERFGRVVRDAVGYRGGSGTSMYWGFIERKRHALELVDELIRRAGAVEAVGDPGSNGR
ncbi:MAG: aminoglycoside adenylyltransferase domain-containing protein [Acidimicrobiales bacterium]